MGSSLETGSPPMLEVPCPEYFVTTIGRVESAGGDNLRFFMCVLRGTTLVPVYTVVMPTVQLVHAARAALFAAAEHHNTREMVPRQH